MVAEVAVAAVDDSGVAVGLPADTGLGGLEGEGVLELVKAWLGLLATPACGREGLNCGAEIFF